MKKWDSVYTYRCFPKSTLTKICNLNRNNIRVWQYFQGRRKEDCAVDLREDPKVGVIIANLTEVPVSGLETTLKQLEIGSLKRVTAATAMNAVRWDPGPIPINFLHLSMVFKKLFQCWSCLLKHSNSPRTCFFCNKFLFLCFYLWNTGLETQVENDPSSPPHPLKLNLKINQRSM